MRICTIDELVDQNFNVIFINALQQFWHTTRSFQCIGAPKKQNLFLYLNGCKITYTDKNGQTFVANSGDVVYTPVGSEYRAQLSDFKDSGSHTIGINFFLQDNNGESIILSDDIQIFHDTEKQVFPILFQKLLHYDTFQSLLKSRIILMEIICSLASRSPAEKAPGHIVKALQYLSDHIEENPKVAKLAELCNISEVYFRKQFKTYVGVTPMEYRNSLRLDRARSYLEYGDISVQEISDTLGYSTVSHFIKEFKQRYGCSPLQYRKKIGTTGDRILK